MNILIVTQKVDMNDPILGFFHRWLIEFSKNFSQVTVICLEKGQYDLPENIRVLSLGKEEGKSRLRILINFYRYIFRERQFYDRVFVHMNQIYVILGAPVWYLWDKKIYLWYTHKSISPSLRLATLFSHKIFTASKESFRIKSKKVIVSGHGIDTDTFVPSPTLYEGKDYRIITIGRISPVKDYEIIVKAVNILADNKMQIQMTIVGGPVTMTDRIYFEKIKKAAKSTNSNNSVLFTGPVAPRDTISFLQNSDVFVSTSNTGSLDKAPLEAMSCGLVVVSSNDALRPILEPYGLSFPKHDMESLLNLLWKIREMDNRKELGMELREIILKNHSLKSLVLLIAQKMIE